MEGKGWYPVAAVSQMEEVEGAERQRTTRTSAGCRPSDPPSSSRGYVKVCDERGAFPRARPGYLARWPPRSGSGGGLGSRCRRARPRSRAPTIPCPVETAPKCHPARGRRQQSPGLASAPVSTRRQKGGRRPEPRSPNPRRRQGKATRSVKYLVLRRLDHRFHLFTDLLSISPETADLCVLSLHQ